MSKPEILIVEDEALVALDIEGKLEELGYSVAGLACSAQEATAQVEKTRPQLVLMDIQLGGGAAGVQAAEEIRARFDIPVVYVTAYADDATLQKAILAEPYGYVTKPFSKSELRSAVELALHRHRSDRSLKESERWLATTLTSIGDAVIAADATRRVKFMNPAAEVLTGWSQAQATGADLGEVVRLVSDAAQPKLEALVAQTLADGTGGLVDRGLLIARDTRKVPVDTSIAPIRTEDGGVIGVLLVCRDISEQRRLHAGMIRAEKLAALGRLTASLAHEIENPLQAVIGCLGLAQEALTEGEDVGKYLEVARSEIRRVARTVAQMRDLYRSDAGEKEPADVNALLDQVLLLSKKPCQESRVEVIWEPAPELPALLLAADQIKQVFLNLILNALEAMPQGGQLRVSTSGTSQPPGVRIRFSDTGTGITPQVLAHLFEPFYSTKPDGTGLGLAISYDIVKEHAGSISVDTELHKGSTFVVWLPV